MCIFRHLRFDWVCSLHLPTRTCTQTQHNSKTPAELWKFFRIQKPELRSLTLVSQFRYHRKHVLFPTAHCCRKRLPPLLLRFFPTRLSKVTQTQRHHTPFCAYGCTHTCVHSVVTCRLKLLTLRRYTATWIQKPRRGLQETWDRTWACHWMTKSDAKLMSERKLLRYRKYACSVRMSVI